MRIVTATVRTTQHFPETKRTNPRTGKSIRTRVEVRQLLLVEDSPTHGSGHWQVSCVKRYGQVYFNLHTLPLIPMPVWHNPHAPGTPWSVLGSTWRKVDTYTSVQALTDWIGRTLGDHARAGQLVWQLLSAKCA